MMNIISLKLNSKGTAIIFLSIPTLFIRNDDRSFTTKMLKDFDKIRTLPKNLLTRIIGDILII